MEPGTQSDDGWEKVRCPNPSCKSAKIGGAVLFERRGSMHRKGPRGGQLLAAGTPFSAQCEQCGYHWMNEEIVAFDGIGAVFQRLLAEVAARVTEHLADDHPPVSPRRRLRGAVAA